MPHNTGSLFDAIFEHYIAICLFLALFMMTLTGVGDVRITSMAGFFLCAVGFIRKSAEIDLWVFVPMALYNIAVTLSSYAAYGNITDGYGGLHLIFPVIYLLTACLNSRELLLLERLCTVWAGLSAAIGAAGYALRAVFENSGGRLNGILGNPNASGIFWALSWFMLLHCLPEKEDQMKENLLTRILPYLEPVLFFALALTLSMGSFAAMAAGIFVLVLLKYKKDKRGTLQYICRILAKTVLGVGTGLLLYLGASRTSVPWICAPLLLYASALVLCWKDFQFFLKAHTRMAAGITAAGILIAGTVVMVRPGSFATFSERLEMMRAALPYLTDNPLLGIGPYQWRMLDMRDGGKYFATWHIHNVLLHAGVEFGWIAAAALAVMGVRLFQKKDPPAKAGFTAYCLHNMIDTSFFYMGITSFALLLTGASQTGGRHLGSRCVKFLFGLFAALNAVHFICSFTT